MSKKKSRRSASASRRRRVAPARAAKRAPQTNTKVDFASEYRYVLTDLRRFGILAVSMFATLVVLALLIR